MLAFLRDLIRAAEVDNTITPLVFVGGQQTGTSSRKGGNWKWYDATTSAANIDLLWDVDASQPE